MNFRMWACVFPRQAIWKCESVESFETGRMAAILSLDLHIDNGQTYRDRDGRSIHFYYCREDKICYFESVYDRMLPCPHAAICEIDNQEPL